MTGKRTENFIYVRMEWLGHKKFFHAFNVLPDLEKTNLSIKEKRYSVEK